MIDAVKDVPLTTHAERDYAPVKVESEFVSLPLDVNAIQVFAHRKDLPDEKGDVLECTVELSLDGGVTWSPKPSGEKSWPWGPFPVVFRTSGGEVRDSQGRIGTVSGVPIKNIPGEGNPLRMVRVTFDPIKDLRSKVEIICKRL